MRARKQSTRQRFLEKRGLARVPRGKEIDHKIPLKDGGSDTLRNMHLIKKSSHRVKTAREARRRAK